MTGVEIAANLSMMACVGVTKEQPWNCSSLLTTPEVGSELRIATKEQAFVHALSSAALVWVISKYCASGQSANCSCAPNQIPAVFDDDDFEIDGEQMDHGKQLQELTRRTRNAVDNRFHHSGCSEDIAFASDFSRRWTDMILPKKKRFRRHIQSDDELLKMHNNAVGREVRMIFYDL